ncbi:MAG: HAD-IC family P-type ATPase, partial [Rouxiella aceris]|uniref:HAD-IC family P-type ATPase n=1 Tax=Rouxiella aceris TaxID=2703884 RepID=UPI00284532B3
MGSATKPTEVSEDFFTSTVDESVVTLEANIKNGLTAAEAKSRLSRWGYNEVAVPKTNPLLQFAGKFWGVSAWMLELVIGLSWYLQKYSDMVIVAALLVVNALIAFYEDRQAEKALAELKSKLHIRAKVLREGVWGTVPAKELVPGDIIRVRSGDFVPADIKVVEGEVKVDQSALTGESAEVKMTIASNLYSGSIVKRGEANGLVLTTGAATFFGRTTQLVQMAHHGEHIEELISKVVSRLLTVVSILVAVTLVIAAYRDLPLLEVLPLALVVLLSAIPVALPVMLTVTTAYGAKELTGEGVLVTRLSASQEAAMVNVICIDKTGTITLNKLTLTAVVPVAPFDEASVLKYAAMASEA